MKKISLALSLAAAIGAGTIVMNAAQAAPGGLSGQLSEAADRLSLIDKTQFFIGGQEYCWYGNGWNGPGWYWCGYDLRPGFGWGGPPGWHNWDRRHPPRPRPGPPHGSGPLPGPGALPGPGSSPVRGSNNLGGRPPKQFGQPAAPKKKCYSCVKKP